MKTKKGIKSAGFTLVETVIAMGIFSVLAVAVINGIILGTAQMSLSRDNLVATQILVSKTESLRAMDWQNVHSLPVTSAEGKFTLRTVVTDKPFRCDYEKYMAKIVFKLSWQTGGIERSRTWTTYVGNHSMPLAPIRIKI